MEYKVSELADKAGVTKRTIHYYISKGLLKMEYKVSELADKAGVTKRTIHYYISKGLLLPPEGSGVNSLYNDEHLQRILLIKKLQAEYMPLNKIREYILENPTEKVQKKAKEIKAKIVTIQKKMVKSINTL